MGEIKLTQNEHRLYEIFNEFADQDIHVSRLAEAFYVDRREWPANWRGSIAAQVRGLQPKLVALGLGDIDRVSRLGTGSTAVYRYRPNVGR